MSIFGTIKRELGLTKKKHHKKHSKKRSKKRVRRTKSGRFAKR